MVLNKIVEDGYAIKVNGDYQITFNGEFFKFNGGYKGEYERNNKALLEERKNQKNMVWLTGILAVGTTIAAYYYLLQIWNWYHH